MDPSPPIQKNPDRARLTAYVLVAVAAFLAGLIIGVAAGSGTDDSQADQPPPNPRAFSR
ncbi:MAG TPA: hypothetical protein VMF63_12540 [Opitutaceae bacterium]|nr:hypothetical protein [Opitutaceae bacterium]